MACTRKLSGVHVLIHLLEDISALKLRYDCKQKGYKLIMNSIKERLENVTVL
jgi:hypothetical protein